MDTQRLNPPQRVTAIAIVVVALGSFLPWVSAFGESVIGLEGDGVITLVLAIAGLVVLALSTGFIGAQKMSEKPGRIVQAVLAGLVTIIALVDMTGFAAIGLYLTLFGGIAWVVGAVWDFMLANQAAQNDNQPPPPVA